LPRGRAIQYTLPLCRAWPARRSLSAAVLVRTTRSPSRRQPASGIPAALTPPPQSAHRPAPTTAKPPPPATPAQALGGLAPPPPIIPRCPSADSVAHCAGAAASPRPQPRRTERRAPSPRKTRYVPATAPAPRPAALRPAACPFSPLSPLAGARSRLPCDSRRARGANTAEFKGCLQDPPHAVVLRVLLSTF